MVVFFEGEDMENKITYNSTMIRYRVRYEFKLNLIKCHLMTFYFSKGGIRTRTALLLKKYNSNCDIHEGYRTLHRRTECTIYGNKEPFRKYLDAHTF